MSDPESGRPAQARKGQPKPALDAVLGEAAGDPLRRAMWLDALDRQWRSLVPINLRGHVRLGNVAGGRMSLLAESPLWASRARLAADELLLAARSIGLEAKHLQVRVAHNASPPVPALEKRPTTASRTAVGEVLALLRKE
ncbi:DUF721 domain-containing protein [Lysobacter pythonis]|uniref:DUF721 domain-containing protein n=1 Tax=Solilutibacter pythonis TaxID=2483112 RepID=A0A3M2I208_9GAMM|nr:DciA family protein [Lysobacter pythonis]RMH94193.1 DUF721 domain-containing protein [Lysobacter pythonis]